MQTSDISKGPEILWTVIKNWIKVTAKSCPPEKEISKVSDCTLKLIEQKR